ncbi:MAG: prepilin-type N-terminal cleavage/methylation domain-containing protein [Pseudomonadota bacterium]
MVGMHLSDGSSQRGQAPRGFTLLELMVVAAVLAVVALLVIFQLGDQVDDSRLSVARYELTQLREAVLAFDRDAQLSLDLDCGAIGTPFDLADAAIRTTLRSPAEAGFLLRSQRDIDDDGTDEWNFCDFDPEYRVGWRGPYLSGLKPAYTAVDAALEFDGTDDGTSAVLDNVLAIPDPFDRDAAAGLFAWSDTPDYTTPTYPERRGRPYLFFALGEPDARIVSMGPNGVYEPPTGDPCVPPAGSDDLVLCIN